MLVRGVWIVNKVVGVSWCDAPECKEAPAVKTPLRLALSTDTLGCLVTLPITS